MIHVLGLATRWIYSSTLVNDAIVIGQDVDSNIVGLTSLCLSLKTVTLLYQQLTQLVGLFQTLL